MSGRLSDILGEMAGRPTVASVTADVAALQGRVELIASGQEQLRESIDQIRQRMEMIFQRLGPQLDEPTIADAQDRGSRPRSAEHGAEPPGEPSRASRIGTALAVSDGSSLLTMSTEELRLIKLEQEMKRSVILEMKDCRIRHARDLRFETTYLTWVEACRHIPADLTAKFVVLAFADSAEQVYRTAEKNGELATEYSAQQRWAWARSVFWSPQLLESVEQEYCERKWTKGESVANYHRAVYELGAALGKSEASMKSDFVRGLPRDIQQMGRLHAATETFFGMILPLEKNYGSTLEKGRSFAQGRPVFRPPGAAVNVLHDSEPNLGGVPPDPAKETEDQKLIEVEFLADRVAAVLGVPGIGGNRLMANSDRVVCRRCQGTGHYAGDCLAPAPVRRATSAAPASE